MRSLSGLLEAAVTTTIAEDMEEIAASQELARLRCNDYDYLDSEEFM